MELTKTQKLLLNGLQLFGVERGAIIGIMVALQEEDEMYELMYFMADNPEATQEDILYKTAQIKHQVEGL